LKAAWFQPLDLLVSTNEKLVSKLCFFKCNLCRYTALLSLAALLPVALRWG
jgi:hypothetical protein